MSSGFIYKWVNQINGKWYIGSHKGSLDDGYRHSSRILSAAEQKYGLENFSREILFEGNYEEDQIREKEAAFLKFYDAANNPDSYNQSNIRGTSCISQEAREKISLANSLRERGPEERQKLSEAHKGKKKTPEHIAKMSRALKGRTVWNKGIPRTEEWKQRHSKRMKGRTPASIVCEHCNRSICGPSNYYRYHDKNCKHRKTQ